MKMENMVWIAHRRFGHLTRCMRIIIDADFLLEEANNILIVEYKNADTKKAREARYKTPAFNPMDDKKFTSTVRKFYDSLHYIHLLGKNKPVKYVYVVEAPNSDAIMRKRLRARMKTLLPFALHENINTGISLIDKVDVLSINEWNMHDEYGKYPFVKL